MPFRKKKSACHFEFGQASIRAPCTLGRRKRVPGSSATGPEQPGQMGQRGDGPDHREQFEKAGVAEHASPGSSGTGPVAESAGAGNADAGISDAGPAKKARTDAADTVPSSGSSGPSWAQLEQQATASPQSAEDVMELRRLGPDLFEATKRSGESWVGDV